MSFLMIFLPFNSFLFSLLFVISLPTISLLLFPLPLFHSHYFTPCIFSLPTLSLPQLFASPLFHSVISSAISLIYFLPNYFLLLFHSTLFCPHISLTLSPPDCYFPRSFPSITLSSWCVQSSLFQLILFQPFTSSLSSVIFRTYELLSTILSLLLPKIPLFYSHLHFSSRKQYKHFSSPKSIWEFHLPFHHHTLPAITNLPAITANQATTIHINAGSIPHFIIMNISIHLIH